MPKSRNRKKKDPLVQIIKEPQYIYKDYKGERMRVPNPRYGQIKTIRHAPQQPPTNKDNSIRKDSRSKDWGDE